MHQQHPLQQIQRRHEQEVILPVAPLSQKPLQTRDQPDRDVPLEALLQLEEFAKGGVVFELGKLFRRRSLVGVLLCGCCRSGADGDRMSLLVACCPYLRRVLGRGRGAGEADLREEAFELAEAFADLAAVEGGEVVEGEGEEGLHCGLFLCAG